MRRALALLIALALIATMTPRVEGGPTPDPTVIGGFITDGTGAALSGVTVLAQNTTTGELFSIASNATGEFGLSVPAGTYNLSASLANYSADRSYLGIVVPDDLGKYYNFTMTEVLCTVSGYVLAGLPLSGVTITISNAQYNYSALTSSPYGRYEIRGIQPGVYVAIAEKRGYTPDSLKEPLILSRGDNVELNFTLVIQPAQIYGTVTSDSNKPLSEVKVTLTPKDGSAGTFTSTDSNGNYSFLNLPVGEYTIQFEKTDYQAVSKDVSLNPYEVRPIDVEMTKVIKNTTAVLFGYDLAHSFMIVGFITGLIVVLFGVFISIRAQKRSNILVTVEPDEELPPKE